VRRRPTHRAWLLAPHTQYLRSRLRDQGRCRAQSANKPMFMVRAGMCSRSDRRLSSPLSCYHCPSVLPFRAFKPSMHPMTISSSLLGHSDRGRWNLAPMGPTRELACMLRSTPLFTCLEQEGQFLVSLWRGSLPTRGYTSFGPWASDWTGWCSGTFFSATTKPHFEIKSLHTLVPCQTPTPSPLPFPGLPGAAVLLESHSTGHRMQLTAAYWCVIARAEPLPSRTH
jgi:hypothetical protein